MMRSRAPLDDEDAHPDSKRPKQNADYDTNERVKLALHDRIQSLSNLVDERRAEVELAELQLGKARKRLLDAEIQLANAKKRINPTASLTSDSHAKVKTEIENDSPMKEKSVKPLLVVPGSNSDSNVAAKGGLTKKVPEVRTSLATPENLTSRKMKAVKTENVNAAERHAMKKLPEPREPVNIVPYLRSKSSPEVLRVSQVNYVTSQHKRKLRNLAINPTSDQICATSALDGVINLWQIQGRGSGLCFLSSVDCLSPKQRRWPEDMVWHPNGDCLVACYSADGQDNQVAIVDSSAKVRAKFLDVKPHVRGIINSIAFLPWGNDIFVTGGSDHAVCLWEEKETNEGTKWTAKALHRSQHSSAVMSVAGLQHKELVLSGGADKRVVAHDIRYNRSDARYNLESKVMGVLPNPADFNLFMVQTGTPGEQLQLYDIRVQRTELHTFGWKQETSDSQSALINQTWSPDGFFIASGSTDPKIHIFDIRYNSKEPSQSIKAHHKRVFKAAWHHNLPLLVSISSDLNIGIHKFFT